MIKKLFILIAILLIIPIFVISCEDEEFEYSRLVFITMGDSLTHGVQNTGQSRQTQMEGYSYQLGMALKSYFGDDKVVYEAPLMDDSGVQREDPYLIPTNVGIGSAEVNHLLDTNQFGSDTPDGQTQAVAMFMAILYAKSFPDDFTQLDAAIYAANYYDPGPDGMILISLWIGGNDFLGCMDGCSGDDEPTPVDEFTEDYIEIVETLLDETPDYTHIVVCSVPDVSVIGTNMYPDDLHFYLDPVGLSEYADMLEEDEVLSGFTDNYHVMREIISFVKNDDMASLAALMNGKRILDEKDKALVTYYTGVYNDFIEDLAAQYSRVHFIDLTTSMGVVSDYPQQYGDYLITTKWGPRGGMFSLDGIHPSATGNALMADSFISAFNDIFGWDITHIDIGEVASNDAFLIDEDGDGFIPPIDYIKLGMVYDFAYDSDDTDPDVNPLNP